MIQRIQSVYLALIALFNGLLVLVFPIWKTQNDQLFYAYQGFKSDHILILTISLAFILITVLSILSLFSFKKRPKQIGYNRFNIIINFYLLGVLLYYLLNLSGEIIISEKGIGALFPLLSIALLVLANKGIQKDEALVKAADRLR